MTLNKRDQTIAFIVGGAVIVYILYAFVLNALYFQPLKGIETKIAAQKKKIIEDKDLLANKAANEEEWRSLQEKGLLENQAEAANQFSNAVFTIARNTRFNIVNWNAPNGRTSNPKSDFDEMRFQATGSGSTRLVGQFLLALESAGLPMRLDDISIATKKDGQDDLNVEMTLTALVYAPKANGRPIRTAPTTRATTGPATRRGPGPLPPAGNISSGTGRGGTGAGTGRGTGRGLTPATAPATLPALSPDAETDIVARLKAKREAENGGMTPPVTPGATPTTTPTGGVQ